MSASAFGGWRLRISGVTVPNTIMKKGSWNVSVQKRLISSYVDASGVLHEKFYEKNKTVIKFTIREHSIEDHDEIISYFPTEPSQFQPFIQFWNDNTARYGYFYGKVNDINWNHKETYNDKIWYAETEIVIEEY